MDPVEEFVRLKEEIRLLQTRADDLRDRFLQPGARLKSNRHEVVVRLQSRRHFLRDRLPPEVLGNPAYWEDRRSAIVTVRALDSGPGAERGDTLCLIEPFAPD